MQTIKLFFVTLFITSWSLNLYSEKLTLVRVDNIKKIPSDIKFPALSDSEAAPGKRFKDQLAKYKNTEIFHLVYLPTNWKKNNVKKYPVIVEYAGNGYSEEKSVLGYGISGGKDFICINLPYVEKDKKKNALWWWGNLKATLDYCKTAVPEICKKYGGDPDKVILAGFSRGSIACNYIGLHDDEIAKLWKAFICHSHYDDRAWAGPKETRTEEARLARLKRLNGRPQFITHERAHNLKGDKVNLSGTAKARKKYLEKHHPNGNFTCVTISFSQHCVDWVLKDIPERKMVRDWLEKIVK